MFALNVTGLELVCLGLCGTKQPIHRKNDFETNFLSAKINNNMLRNMHNSPKKH